MELLNEIITNWYLVLWLASGGVALAVWVWASKRKVRMDIDQAAKMILEQRYRNAQMSKKEFEKQTEYEATGISVPGMPMGSPGMEGFRKDSYNVVLFDDAGNRSVYAQH